MPAMPVTDAFVRNVKPPSAEGQRQITYLHNLERGLKPEKSDAGGDESHSISHRSRHSGSRPRSRAGSSSDQAVSATDAR